ncbi:hypothetical protein [Fusibacter ferrireducens]|uniref:Uncharacterized protein n=1 Tax=Fusibacter ferrireducens TaxID=2785058 RepID=A0ABR9ZPH7_9FIRM|nr:hypothetical protein [Fusibacter ferrireducens]MBF4692319.1 hypothetical protein [Fusibacter ferrireducens]
MTRQLIPNLEQEKVIELMCEVLELSDRSEQNVIEVIEKVGIEALFNSVDVLEIEEDEKDRIKALKEVIETKAKSIALMEGGL